jgi:hypothetical protein
MAHLSTLPPGMASVYAEGDDHAYLVQVTRSKDRPVPLNDDQLRASSSGYASVADYHAIRDFAEYGILCGPFGSPDRELYQGAGLLLDTERRRQLLGAILMRACFNRSRLLDLLNNRMARNIEEVFPQLTYIQRHEHMLRMVIVRGCAETLQARGASAGWPFSLVDTMRRYLSHGLIRLLDTGDLGQAEDQLSAFADLYLEHLRRQRGPFAGCVHCQAKCVYRWDTHACTSAQDRRRVDDMLRSGGFSEPQDRYQAILKVVTASMSRQWLGGGQSPQEVGMGYCSALQIASQSGYTEYDQEAVATGLTQAIAETGA